MLVFAPVGWHFGTGGGAMPAGSCVSEERRLVVPEGLGQTFAMELEREKNLEVR